MKILSLLPLTLLLLIDDVLANKKVLDFVTKSVQAVSPRFLPPGLTATPRQKPTWYGEYERKDKTKPLTEEQLWWLAENAAKDQLSQFTADDNFVSLAFWSPPHPSKPEEDNIAQLTIPKGLVRPWLIEQIKHDDKHTYQNAKALVDPAIKLMEAAKAKKEKIIIPPEYSPHAELFMMRQLEILYSHLLDKDGKFPVGSIVAVMIREKAKKKGEAPGPFRRGIPCQGKNSKVSCQKLLTDFRVKWATGKETSRPSTPNGKRSELEIRGGSRSGTPPPPTTNTLPTIEDYSDGEEYTDAEFEQIKKVVEKSPPQSPKPKEKTKDQTTHRPQGRGVARRSRIETDMV